MLPPFNMDGNSTCPLGFPMSQNRAAVPTWSYAMEVDPPAQIVELGSMNGGFTTAIGVHAYRIGCRIYSFDRQVTPQEDFKALSDFLGIQFIMGDIFAMTPIISGLIQRPGRTYLLCDNGDKVKEFNLFAGVIKPGDIIAAHDYCAPIVGERCWPWSEIRKEQVHDSVEKHGLQPFLQDHFDLAGWLAYKKL